MGGFSNPPEMLRRRMPHGSVARGRRVAVAGARSRVGRAMARRRLARAFRRHSHVVVLVALSALVCFWATTTITMRVRLGQQQQRAIDAMAQDPMAFVLYAIQTPDSVSPLGLDEDASSAQDLLSQWKQTVQNDPKQGGDDFAELFAKVYGQWSSQINVDLAEIVQRHCGSREFALMVEGKHDDEACGRSGGFLYSAAGKWPIEPASCRAGFFADDRGRAKPSPSGTFSVDGQACVVICARGSTCNQSMPIDAGLRCKYPHHSAGNQDVDSDVGKCPGAKNIFLCPEGFFCRTPIDMQTCPRGSFCPVGTDRPFRCPWIGSRCDRTGLTRPQFYYRSFFIVSLLIVFLSLRWYKMSIQWTKAHSREDAAITDFIWRWRRRRQCCRWLLSSKSRVLKWVLLRASPIDQTETAASLPLFRGARSASYVRDLEEDRGWERGDVPLVDLSFHRLRLVLNGTVAIDDVSGRCRAGCTSAIIGPSGGGKSCLLGMLANRGWPARMSSHGVVRYNGVDARTLPHGHVLTALVPQSDEALIHWMTVYETLNFYAAICGVPHTRVDHIMQQIDLSHLAHSRIGRGGLGADRGLSGGERCGSSSFDYPQANASEFVLLSTSLLTYPFSFLT